MKRREFIALLGGAAAAWPLAARAQQPMPVIGFISGGSPEGSTTFLAAFGRGLQEAGLVERHNVAVEYRWASGAYERLPGLTAELIARPVDVLAAFGTPAVRVVKAVTASSNPKLPVVFAAGLDPVEEGIVESLSRPGGNITGITSITASLGPKRLELMRQITPHPTAIAILINPGNPMVAAERRDAEAAARAIGQELQILTASTEREIDAAFETMRERRIGALIIVGDLFFFSQLRRLAALSIQSRVPAMAPLREFTASGGLMTYGASIADTYRLAAIYTARILKGAKPSELPVQQPTKFDLVINLKTAKTLGLEVPAKLLALADEVIE